MIRIRHILLLLAACVLHAGARQLFDKAHAGEIKGPLGIVNDSLFIVLDRPSDSSKLFSIKRMDRAGDIVGQHDIPVLFPGAAYSRYDTWDLSINDECGRLTITGKQVSYFKDKYLGHEFHYDPLVIVLDASGKVVFHKVLQSYVHMMNQSFACDESRWALLSSYPEYDSSYLFESDWQGGALRQKFLKNQFRGRDEIQIRPNGFTLAGFKGGGAYAAADSLIAIETDNDLAVRDTRKFLVPRPAIDFITGYAESVKYYLNGPGYYAVLYAIPNNTYDREDTISLLAYRYDVAAGRMDSIPMGSYPMDNPWGWVRKDRSGFTLSLRHSKDERTDTAKAKSQSLLAFDHRMRLLLEDSFEYAGAINMIGTGMRNGFYAFADIYSADTRLKLYQFEFDAPVSLSPRKAGRIHGRKRSGPRDILGREAAGPKPAIRFGAD